MEMRCPISMAATAQVGSGIGHLMAAIAARRDFRFEERIGANRVVHEPIVVVALITPWHWPTNQDLTKAATQLAAGQSLFPKPSEEAQDQASNTPADTIRRT